MATKASSNLIGSTGHVPHLPTRPPKTLPITILMTQRFYNTGHPFLGSCSGDQDTRSLKGLRRLDFSRAVAVKINLEESPAIL